MKYEKIKKHKNKFVLYQLPEAYSGFRPQCLLVYQPIILEKKNQLFFHGAITNHMCKKSVSLIANNWLCK